MEENDNSYSFMGSFSSLVRTQIERLHIAYIEFQRVNNGDVQGQSAMLANDLTLDQLISMEKEELQAQVKGKETVLIIGILKEVLGMDISNKGKVLLLKKRGKTAESPTTPK